MFLLSPWGAIKTQARGTIGPLLELEDLSLSLPKENVHRYIPFRACFKMGRFFSEPCENENVWLGLGTL